MKQELHKHYHKIGKPTKKVLTIGRNIRKTLFKKPYFKRGRRVDDAPCRMCGEFISKMSELRYKFVDSLTRRIYEIIYVVCGHKHHGLTVIEERYVKTQCRATKMEAWKDE